MGIMLTILEWKLNMIETALKDEPSTLVKIGLVGGVVPYMQRCVSLGVLPMGAMEIIMSNWKQRIRGEWKLTCHAVEVLENRHQFAAPPPCATRRSFNRTARIDLLTA